MVSGRARAAQLGPVRSGPALRKGQEGWKPGEEGGLAVAGGGGRGPRERPAAGVVRRGSGKGVPGAQVTGNSHTFWRSHLAATPAHRASAPAHCAPEAAALPSLQRLPAPHGCGWRLASRRARGRRGRRNGSLGVGVRLVSGLTSCRCEAGPTLPSSLQAAGVRETVWRTADL